MDLNLEKTNVFRNRGPLRLAEKWFFNGVPIDVVSFINISVFILLRNLYGLKHRKCKKCRLQKL